jgi:hypothetical protein
MRTSPPERGVDSRGRLITIQRPQKATEGLVFVCTGCGRLAEVRDVHAGVDCAPIAIPPAKIIVKRREDCALREDGRVEGFYESAGSGIHCRLCETTPHDEAHDCDCPCTICAETRAELARLRFENHEKSEEGKARAADWKRQRSAS